MSLTELIGNDTIVYDEDEGPRFISAHLKDYVSPPNQSGRGRGRGLGLDIKFIQQFTNLMIEAMKRVTDTNRCIVVLDANTQLHWDVEATGTTIYFTSKKDKLGVSLENEKESIFVPAICVSNPPNTNTSHKTRGVHTPQLTKTNDTVNVKIDFVLDFRKPEGPSARGITLTLSEDIDDLAFGVKVERLLPLPPSDSAQVPPPSASDSAQVPPPPPPSASVQVPPPPPPSASVQVPPPPSASASVPDIDLTLYQSLVTTPAFGIEGVLNFNVDKTPYFLLEGSNKLNMLFGTRSEPQIYASLIIPSVVIAAADERPQFIMNEAYTKEEEEEEEKRMAFMIKINLGIMMTPNENASLFSKNHSLKGKASLGGYYAFFGGYVDDKYKDASLWRVINYMSAVQNDETIIEGKSLKSKYDEWYKRIQSPTTVADMLEMAIRKSGGELKMVGIQEYTGKTDFGGLFDAIGTDKYKQDTVGVILKVKLNDSPPDKKLAIETKTYVLNEDGTDLIEKNTDEMMTTPGKSIPDHAMVIYHDGTGSAYGTLNIKMGSPPSFEFLESNGFLNGYEHILDKHRKAELFPPAPDKGGKPMKTRKNKGKYTRKRNKNKTKKRKIKTKSKTNI